MLTNVLGKIGPHLAEGDRQSALRDTIAAVAASREVSHTHAATLARLTPLLTDEARATILRDAVADGKTADGLQRIQYLKRLMPCLEGAGRATTLDDAYAAIEHISDRSLDQAVFEFAPYLTEARCAQVLAMVHRGPGRYSLAALAVARVIPSTEANAPQRRIRACAPFDPLREHPSFPVPTDIPKGP